MRHIVSFVRQRLLRDQYHRGVGVGTVATLTTFTMSSHKVIVERIKPIPGGSRSDRHALADERALFVQAFMEAYSPLAICREEIGDDDKLRSFLHSAFDEDERAFDRSNENDEVRKTNTKTWRSWFYRAIVDGEHGGYLSVDVSHENKQVYMRQMAVHPKCQRRGVASGLFSRLVQDVGDSLMEVRVSCRKWNEGAVRTYIKLGFKEDAECEQGLDGRVYRGFIWTREGHGRT